MINPEDDGITHINVYSQARTPLGKMLSNWYFQQVRLDEGPFNSVEGYWFWLTLPESAPARENLRKLYGYDAKKIGKNLQKIYGRVSVDNFENKILRAIWEKVKMNERYFIKEYDELPFVHYYNFKGNIIDVTEKYDWMLDGITLMRNNVISRRKHD